MATTFDIQLPHYPRGFHLITRDILSLLPDLPENGLLVVFIKHTSAGIAINENADPDVRHDFNTFFNKLVPDGAPYFVHTLEGPDDMSAHIKASLIGTSVSIPIRNHRLNLGTWQGIYLCEFRDGGDKRKLSITIWSKSADLQRHRTMIGVNGVIQNNGFFQQRAYRLADHTIIDSPPFVLGTRIETVTPPSILLLLRIKRTERINEARRQETGHPFPFFGQETTVGSITNRIVNIDRFMANVIIPTKNQIGT